MSAAALGAWPTEGTRPAPETSIIELCSVRVGGAHFGVPIRQIVEIVGATRTLPVPLAPAFVGGLAHYRGEVLTTVSMRRLLEMPVLSEPKEMLVLEGAGGCFGLEVDAIGEILAVPATVVERMPSTLSESATALFAGTCKLPGRLLVLLNPDELDPVRLSVAFGR